MITLVKSDLEALAFLFARGVYPDRATFQGVLFMQGGNSVGAAGIDQIDTTLEGVSWNATVHSAGNGYWAKGALTMFFSWLFIECGFRRLTAECDSMNLRARQGMKFLGFTQEGIKRCAAPNGNDIAIFGMLKEECRLICFAKGNL